MANFPDSYHMANDEHLTQLKKGVAAWNAWREQNPDIYPDLCRADLFRASLSGANLSGADLRRARLGCADLSGADLSGAILYAADLVEADLRKANLHKATLIAAILTGANLIGATLGEVELSEANLIEGRLCEANLAAVDVSRADLRRVDLSGANLSGANLWGSDFSGARLSRANLSGANLEYATLVDADFRGADLTGCYIYGISAWNLKLEGAEQQNLGIARRDEPEITVDNIEVAQFIYLLLHNEKIREVIDTVGRKGVLLLGRFTEGRIEVLDRLRKELRQRGYVPIVFNFDKPETKDFTETVRLLAGLSHFVIADVTNPKSAPLELQATVPEIMVPFQPIIQMGEKPFAMLKDLWIKHHDWLFEPIEYSSVDRLAETMDAEIIEPAEARFNELVMRRAEAMKVRRV